MRMAIAIIAVLGIQLSATRPTCGAEPAAKLPTPGGWARYHVNSTQNSGESSVHKLLLKSLSKTTKDGVDCCWLECEGWSNDDELHNPVKFLIPEKTILSTATPTDEILIYLQHDARRQVCSVPPRNQGWMPDNYLYFPGFLKDAKLEPNARTVKHQTGTLEIAQAHVGTYKWSRKKQDPEATTFETKYKVWLHPDLPIGFAHAQTSLTIYNGETKVRSWDHEYSLEEFGDNAKETIVEESAPPI